MFIINVDCPCCMFHARRMSTITQECKQNGMGPAEIFEELRKHTNNDHCESCWDRFHNGKRDKDYEERGRFK